MFRDLRSHLSSLLRPLWLLLPAGPGEGVALLQVGWSCGLHCIELALLLLVSPPYPPTTRLADPIVDLPRVGGSTLVSLVGQGGSLHGDNWEESWFIMVVFMSPLFLTQSWAVLLHGSTLLPLVQQVKHRPAA